jgi:hypothetical protein
LRNVALYFIFAGKCRDTSRHLVYFLQANVIFRCRDIYTKGKLCLVAHEDMTGTTGATTTRPARRCRGRSCAALSGHIYHASAAARLCRHHAAHVAASHAALANIKLNGSATPCELHPLLNVCARVVRAEAAMVAGYGHGAAACKLIARSSEHAPSSDELRRHDGCNSAELRSASCLMTLHSPQARAVWTRGTPLGQMTSGHVPWDPTKRQPMTRKPWVGSQAR